LLEDGTKYGPIGLSQPIFSLNVLYRWMIVQQQLYGRRYDYYGGYDGNVIVVNVRQYTFGTWRVWYWLSIRQDSNRVKGKEKKPNT
jgi:hypothetical protein